MGETVRRSMQYVARLLGNTEHVNGEDVIKPRFMVGPWLADATYAELIIAWAHARMLCESDDHGRPNYAPETARSVMYSYSGPDEGIYSDLTEAEVVCSLSEMRGRPPVSFVQNVEAQLINALKNNGCYHVVEDKSPHLALFADGIVDTETKGFKPFDPDVVRLRKLPYGWADAPPRAASRPKRA